MHYTEEELQWIRASSSYKQLRARTLTKLDWQAFCKRFRPVSYSSYKTKREELRHKDGIHEVEKRHAIVGSCVKRLEEIGFYRNYSAALKRVREERERRLAAIAARNRQNLFYNTQG